MNTIDSSLREKIIASYNGGDLSCHDLLFLLDHKISAGAERARNKFVRILADAGTHRNLMAHNTNSNDKTMHYTIFVDGNGYHLRLDRKNIVFQITDSARRDLGTIPPWAATGANY